MTALETARRWLAGRPAADAVDAVDAESPPPVTALPASTAYPGERPEPARGERHGLSDAWLAVLRRRAGRGDRAAAREAAELEAYLAACDRGEVVIPPHPNEPALMEWNRKVRERSKPVE